MILFAYPKSESGQRWWAFDHMNDHSQLATGIEDSSSLTGAARYFLDPLLGQSIPASTWNQWHQQAHNDAAVYYGLPGSLPNLIQGSPSDQWWLFNNSWEHVALDGLSQG